MRRVLFIGTTAILLSLSLSLPSWAQVQTQTTPTRASQTQIPEIQLTKSFQTISVNEIHAGMRGVAYTVFQGTKPEAMGVEVLGILKNANGPKGDIILVRLSGEKAEYTGVVAGMSGSPVYLNGKLAGALAFRIGEFSKEPIAGVTPISEMLEISAIDSTIAPSSGTKL